MHKTRGFTLIELLVVVSVIALRPGILMPVLMKAKEHTRRMVCCNNLRVPGVANTLYAEDADSWCAPIMDRTPGDNR
jgi:prepilin-type N-terminal cleavage/methylation domain-containing protein